MKTIVTVLALVLCGFVSQAQTAIKVDKSGKGSAVIFLPGFTCPGTVWDETIKQLPGKHQVHVVSYAGFNGIAPIEMPWYQSVKDQLIAYVREGRFKNVTLVGHSMGGTLALEVAAALPDQVTKVVAVDALPCLRELWMPGVAADKITYENPYNNKMLAMNADEFRNNATMMAGSMTNNQAKTGTLVGWIVESDRKTYVYGYTDLLKVDARQDLTSVKAKSLVIAASFPDKNTVLANMEKQYANLKDKQIVIADNSRHFVMFDQPDWFYTQVNAFLAE
jgi:pimeloyl-ACP methyl ester carboxylesterase